MQLGFDAKRLPSVLRAIIRDLRKDHPGIGRVRIPSTLGEFTVGFFGDGKGVRPDENLPRRGRVR